MISTPTAIKSRVEKGREGQRYAFQYLTALQKNPENAATTTTTNHSHRLYIRYKF
jgi:hypothetical protein